MAASASEPIVAPPPETAEVLDYRWRLMGLVGLIARVFLPVSGEGTLSTVRVGGGRLESELKVTSRREADDYWLYGALIEPGRNRVLRAWNSYSFREREKEKRAELDEEGIIDITSGIYLLRNDPPAEPLPLKIWSDGKVYPVLVSPGRTEQRRIGGRPRTVTHYSVTARKEPGERVWSGRLDLWITRDEAAKPLEIDFQSPRGRVRMLLEEDDD